MAKAQQVCKTFNCVGGAIIIPTTRGADYSSADLLTEHFGSKNHFELLKLLIKHQKIFQNIKNYIANNNFQHLKFRKWILIFVLD